MFPFRLVVVRTTPGGFHRMGLNETRCRIFAVDLLVVVVVRCFAGDCCCCHCILTTRLAPVRPGEQGKRGERVAPSPMTVYGGLFRKEYLGADPLHPHSQREIRPADSSSSVSG